MNESSHERTERGARLVGAGILVSRVLGVVRGKIFSHYLGLGMETDAYGAASRIPNALRNLLGEGAISASFVPVYAAALERGDEEGAQALANALLGVLLGGVAILTLLGIALAPQLTSLLVHGFERDPAKAALTTKLLRVIFPMTGLMILSGWCLGVQNAHRRFFMAYASGAMWSLTQIVLLLAAGPHTRDLTVLVWWVSWATLAGSVLQVAAQMPQVTRLMRSVRPTLDFGAPGLGATLANFIPVVGALGLFQISSLIDVQIASFLPDGAIGNINYANQIYLLPLSLFGVATAAAALPQMARDTARGNAGLIGSNLMRSWERVLFYTIPSAIAFVGIGDCIVALMYEGGKFGPDERMLVWLVLAAYALGLVAYASSRLMAAAYQASQNYRRPLMAAAFAIGMSTITALSIAIPFRHTLLAAAGLAMGGAVGAHLNLFLLWKGLRKQLGAIDTSGPAFVAQRTAIAAVIALLPSAALQFAFRTSPMHFVALLVIAVYGVVFLVAARFAGLAEADRMLQMIRRRLRR